MKPFENEVGRLAFIATFLLFAGVAALAQTAPAGSASSSSPSAVAEIDSYLKIVGAIFTIIGTAVAIPIAKLTYRKTSAEVDKLEREAAAAQQAEQLHAAPREDIQGGIRILVDHSPQTTVQVLADPRFLAPLLVLLDFIFAFVLLTLAGHLLSVFGAGILRSIALAVLAAILLLPIAKQVLRVRAVLHPPRDEQERRQSLKHAVLSFSIVYAVFFLSAAAIGLSLLLESGLDLFATYAGWALLAWAAVLAVAFVPLRKRLENFLSSQTNGHSPH